MSFSGPISLMISEVKRRVMRWSSPSDIVFGLQTTPPFAPPKGIPASAHFHVIHIASALTSSSVTSGWYLIPPFDGPRAMLCVTRNPSNTSVPPSSIVTGMETASDFLHSWRTLTRFGLIAKTLATRRSCSRAISNGFSRRCVTGASTVVTSTPFSAQIEAFSGWAGRSLLDRDPDRPDRRGSCVGPECDQPELVVAGGKYGTGRVATGHAERI